METAYFPAADMMEIFENPGASRIIVMQIKLYHHFSPVEHAVCLGLGFAIVTTGIANVTRLLKLTHRRNRSC